MKKSIFLICFFLCPMLIFAQKKVILDTDPSFDPDDAGCIAMLHTLASQGECNILAIVNSTNQKESALCISAINQFYNRPAIPVGDYKGYVKKINATENTYDYHIANEYPRPLKKWDDSHDGVKLYREILESAQDTSITVVIVGTMHNFYGLLRSQPDALSDKTGRELVKQKVKEVVTMGGNFLNNKGLDRTNWGGSDVLCKYTEWSCLNKERNRMCRYVIENCPAPLIASGWENGNGNYYNANNGNVMSGQGLKKLPENHIIRVSYEKHFAYRGGSESITRYSNDQCALHYAIRGEGGNYKAFTNGKITLSASGECEWIATKDGVQGHLQKNREDHLIAQEIEALMMGKTPKLDTSPPSVPTNIRWQPNGGMQWDPSADTTLGSWVVGYNIYQDGKLIHRAYGTKFTGKLLNKLATYEVKSVNASGVESEPGILKSR
ncbi:nucleoside hydrolase [Fulvivirgaceae bacterium BMA12]|uniref:Nucleoside hydrolase n=1 Tax=Agaribacillus aureus TaxID=3051825 RepID=A0ABT8L628_9BACT|nr:nucleoside hydrolase [Fulvivirgaceae bacterium BMA12]